MDKSIQILGWSERPDDLTIAIDGKRYRYKASPYVREHFQHLLQHNKGRALAYLKKNAKLVEEDNEPMEKRGRGLLRAAGLREGTSDPAIGSCLFS